MTKSLRIVSLFLGTVLISHIWRLANLIVSPMPLRM